MGKGFLAALLLAVLLAQGSSALAAGPARVEAIRAHVAAEANLPPLVQERMQKSVQSIADQLMMGRSLGDLEKERSQKEAVIREVFDKILVGYTVESVAIDLGVTTAVHVRLVPWADVIQSVRTVIQVEGMPPEIEAMAREDLAGVETVFQEALVGLPLAATDWSNGVLKGRLKEFMAAHLPEFRADFEVDPDLGTEVVLTVYPRLPVVRTIDLSLRSDTVPNISLMDYREFLKDRANLMIGVPVDFVRRHEAELCRVLSETLDATTDFRRMGIHTEISMKTGENMSVMARSDTMDYRIRLEGMLDVGRKDTDEDLRFRLHVGRRFSRADELFLQTEFFPKDVVWGWAIGYSRDLGTGGSASLRYDMREKRFIVSASQQVLRDWLLRYEYRWTDQRGEVGLRYRLHDFLSLEYVVDSRDNWLRLIGNF